MKHLNALLGILDSLYYSVAAIKDAELSDFVEIGIGVPGLFKLKVDKIIGKIFHQVELFVGRQRN